MIEDALDTTSQEPSASCSARAGRRSGTLVFVIQVAAIALLLGAVVVGFARWRTGSMGRVWPYLAGQRLLIEPMHLELGDVGKGESLERELRVLNLGSKPVKLLGSQNSCGCVSLDDFPIEVPGGAELSLRLGIGTPSEPSVFEHTVKLFSSERGYTTVVVTVSGKVQ